MAAKQKWNVTIKEEEIKNGHDVYFLFPVQELVAVQSRPFTVDYDIYCGSLPTSWTLTLIYNHKKEPYEFSLSATLIRTDHKNDFLNVYVVVLLSCLDANNRLVHFSQEICEKRMAVGDVIQGYVEESASLVSTLKISILVKFCHDMVDFDPDASLSSHVKKQVRCLKF